MPPRAKITAATATLGSDARARDRLRAIAALHQPIPVHDPGSSSHGVLLEPPRDYHVCGECKVMDRYGSRTARAPWPCATARLCGPWPWVE